ncbi:PEP_CTERM-anchored TLD domain-containing protein [Duganella sp. FT3S]|uniref:PEP_CTERM-anchored TLD domain-containing protein n=2 Tax=Rugamonas fusca TaxID=2758568 RepID=A0A7W2EKI0_9BURK|nr:PEP_CTERM-anchored TLD domain-containing protein [Rugamonas fusca]
MAAWSALALSATMVPAGAASLLNAAEQQQLATWLGEGPVAFTNIYTKANGDTSAAFHHAADGKGRTIAVMQATNEKGQTWLIGGYNPQSWASSGGYHITTEQAQRTGFLFNLTTSEIHRQTPKTYALDTVGSYQTLNAANVGPTFGLGNDLYVPADLTHGGYSLLYSYADPNRYNFNTSVLDGSTFVRPNITFGAMEIYTISAVPEPASGALWLGGLGLLALLARRTRSV